MKLYYHRTDGGAQYYSTNPEGPDFFKGCVLRTDGNEIEVYSSSILALGLSLCVHSTETHNGFTAVRNNGMESISPLDY